MKSYLLINYILIRVAVVLIILVFLLSPLQTQAIGHDARLVLPNSESEVGAVTVGRIESPDMLMARTAAEGTGAAFTPTTPTVDTGVPGINGWSIAIYLAIIIALLSVLVLWDKLFPVKEEKTSRVTNRCTLISEGC